MTEQNDNLCKRCGKTFDECKYPVSHSHPTVDAVEDGADQYLEFLANCPALPASLPGYVDVTQRFMAAQADRTSVPSVARSLRCRSAECRVIR